MTDERDRSTEPTVGPAVPYPPPPEIPPPPSAMPPDIWPAPHQTAPAAGSAPPGAYDPSAYPTGWSTQYPPPGWSPAWQPRPPRRGRAIVAALTASALLLAAGVGLGWGLRAQTRAPTQQPVIVGGGQNGLGGQGAGGSGGVSGSDARRIAGAVTPGIVNIDTFMDSSLGSSTQVPEGRGTGMILTSSGEVLTNNHVVEGANTIRATLPAQNVTYRAEVVGVDPSADVALLQLEGASGLATISPGNSSELTGGQRVVAIGNALGRDGLPSVTSGAVSALDQSITVGDDRGGTEHLSGLIQSSASISPGDSGGAVVTTAGRVVGMITASATDGNGQASSSTVGYAIPINNALDVINQIRAGHASEDVIIGQAGFLGIEARNLDPAAAARLGLSATSGALVVGVEPGSPASRAGLRRDSVIVAVNGMPVTSANTLGPRIHFHKPGEAVRVTWVDATGTHTASMQLISGPAV